jgi:zinc protease
MRRHALSLTAVALLAALLMGCEEETRVTAVSETLDNGLRIDARENRASEIVALQAWVADGALFEDADEAGIAHLLAHSIYERTASYGSGEIMRTLDALGGTMSTYSSHDFALFSFVVPSDHFDRALDMVASGLAEPVFDEESIAKAARRPASDGQSSGTGPIDEAYRICVERMLPDHPYGRRTQGTVTTVSAITADDLAERHRKAYGPGSIEIVIVGDVDAVEAAEAVAEALGSLAPVADGVAAPAPPSWPSDPSREVRTGDVRRTYAALAFPGPGIDDPGSVAMDVLLGVLWEGDSSGLQRLLVEELGLASSVSVGWYTRRQPSPLFIWMELEPDALGTAENAVLGAVSRLAADGPSEAEVEEVKDAVRSAMLFNMETAEGQAHNIGYWTSIGGPGFDSEYMQLLGDVTAEDVRSLAERYLVARSRSLAAIVPEETE